MQEPLALFFLSLPPVPRFGCVRMYSRYSMAALSNCLLALCKVLGVAVGIDRTGQAGQGRTRQDRIGHTGSTGYLGHQGLLCGSKWVLTSKVKLGSG